MLQQRQVDQLNKGFGLSNIRLLIVFTHGKESGSLGEQRMLNLKIADCELLTHGVPVEADEIEALMRG